MFPDYAALCARTDGPPGSSWGLFGPDDDLGMLNFLTPQCAVAAAALVTTGEVFDLDYPLNTFVPSLAGTRPATRHTIFANNPNHRDDWVDSFYLQSTSQIDGLRHIRHPVAGFYNGVADAEIVEGAPRLGIQHVAEHGIVGRGVLLDMPRLFAAQGREMAHNQAFTPADLDAAARLHGVRFTSGDILLVHTGWAQWYLGLSTEERASRRRGSPGLHQSHEMLGWLWDHRFSLVAADNSGLEAIPVAPDSGFHLPDEPPPERGPSHNGMMHRQLLALLGLLLGELWKLSALAEACARDGRYEFLLTAKPLNLVGGVGSPPNAMAVK
ncbi:cyclase family protein [Phytohabitans sp. ZYX-F-186]|uniref:Cyclase family protein n=1 Tax=Phytohabitans maris TaxID=3071409 RepID=A0ABU0ZKE1_9ACTN|nr:cyclase family protein [Phytohabitans sp. ZYX-F-186]MDQ7907515.1 cyclase family protein [Phytohabitans sp. ZYX-F-186]